MQHFVSGRRVKTFISEHVMKWIMYAWRKKETGVALSSWMVNMAQANQRAWVHNTVLSLKDGDIRELYEELVSSPALASYAAYRNRQSTVVLRLRCSC